MIRRILRFVGNGLLFRRGRSRLAEKLDLGLRVSDGEVTRKHVVISQARRSEHIAILG